MRLILFISFIVVSACGTQQYHPQEHSIRDKYVRDFEVSGDIYVNSTNILENPEVIYKGLTTTFKTSYLDIANVMAKQLEKEIDENSTIDGELDKYLYIQLDDFYLDTKTEGIQTTLNITILGERGFEKQFKIKTDYSQIDVGDTQASFNNAIAFAVQRMLKSPELLQHLAIKELR